MKQAHWLVEVFVDGGWRAYLKCLRINSAYSAADRVKSHGDNARISWVGGDE